MPYVRDLFLFAQCCPTHIVFCFGFVFFSSCVHYVASLSGCSFLIAPLVFSDV